MALDFPFKDNAQETSLIKHRVVFTGVIIVLLMLLIISRLIYLQFIQHEHYITLSQNNRVKILPIPPIRGLIYSRDGILLAENQPAFSLEIVPERIDDLDKVIKDLSEYVTIEKNDVERFKRLLKEKRRFESVPLRYNLNEQEVARFSVNQHHFPGVEVIARPYRRYPLKDEVSHAIGYVGRVDEQDLEQLDKSNYIGTTHTGKFGAEKAYENLLHGKVGYQQVEINAQGRIIRVLERTPPEPGKDIYLTLDISLQLTAVEALAGKRGAIIALDPDNGDILAMVSSPSYDPNPFVNGIDFKAYRALLQSSDKPLINRVLQGKYPPGSTIKPFLGAAALAYSAVDPSETIWCPGWYSLKGSTHRYRDWKKYGHGHVDLNYSIMQSCDVYFYTLAHELGIDRIHDALTDFGFGRTTDIDIGGESSGLVPSDEWKRKTYHQPWYPGETLIVGIGQGSILATPLQLAVATASLANHGHLVSPRLVYEARDPITNEIESLQNKKQKSVSLYKESHWKTIVQAMEDVVHGDRGTARRSGMGAPYHFAGKTGTAQVIGIAQDEEYDEKAISERFKDHALFIAFGPVEDPRIALAIIVENGGSGSRTAAPIARQLLDHYLINDKINAG